MPLEQQYEIDEDVYESTRFFTMVEARSNPKPLPDTLFSSAYAGRIYVKIAQVLALDRVDLKRQALHVLYELLQQPDNAVKVTQHGDLNLDGVQAENVLLPALVRALHDSDTQCRIIASRCFIVFSGEFFGREILLSNVTEGLFTALLDRINDEDVKVRRLAYDVFTKLAKHNRDAVDNILDTEKKTFARILVRKFTSEKTPNVQVTLDFSS